MHSQSALRRPARPAMAAANQTVSSASPGVTLVPRRFLAVYWYRGRSATLLQRIE